ncbi:hypothetical protein REPUB_Repub20aG0131000 [Reevesia pubescens]
MSNSLFLSFPLSYDPPTLPHIRAFNSRVITLAPIAFSTTRTSPSLALREFLRAPPPIMHSYGKLAATTQPELSQLDDVSDFEKLLSSTNHISICGFGSLLSEKSARSTFPNLLNFRVAKLNGFRRVFAHVAPIFFDRGIAKPETKEISSLSVEPYEGETLIVTVFEIKKSEIPAFIERELEFRFLAVLPETLDGEPFANPAVCENLIIFWFFSWHYSQRTASFLFIFVWNIKCRCFVLVTTMRSSFKLDAKEIRTFISSIMVDTTSIRFGEMISCHAVFISDTVYWQLRILVILPTITLWITLFLETEQPPFGHIWQQLVQVSWKRSLLDLSSLAMVVDIEY